MKSELLGFLSAMGVYSILLGESSVLPSNRRVLFHSAEALFYNRIKLKTGGTNRLTATINNFALNHLSECQFFLSSINFFSSLLAAKQIIDLFSNYSFIAKSHCERYIGGYINRFIEPYFNCVYVSYFPAVVLATTMLASSYFISTRQFKDKPNAKTVKQGGQLFAATVQITHIISSSILALFSKNRISELLSISLNLYSLLKNREINWVENSRREEFGGEQPIKQVDIEFLTLLLGKPNSEEACAICLEPEGVTQGFCTQGHVFHSNCIHEYINRHSEKFFRNNTFTRLETKSERGTTYSYTVESPAANLPTCPICRECPQQHELWFTIHDQSAGHFAGVHTAKATII